MEVGVQASPVTKDASTEPTVSGNRSGRIEEAKGKGKERAKDRRQEDDTPSSSKQDKDTEMVDSDRFTLYEDLSDCEKEVEDVAPVTPPITKKQTTKRQVVLAKAEKPQPVKYKPTTKAIDQERSINTKAFMVHGISCQRPMADTIQDVRKAGIRGIIGARWLLGGQRRTGKATSSVVIFLSIPISFQVQEG